MSLYSDTAALVLAAGKGTRMLSSKPKVLQTIIDVPLLYYSLSELYKMGLKAQYVVAGHGFQAVCDYISADFPEVRTVLQERQLGTGHAVSVAAKDFSRYANVLVLPGDTPLLRAETLKALIEKHDSEDNVCTFITFKAVDPFGYGRIVREGQSLSIVEEADASRSQKLIDEVNSGIYIFRSDRLIEALSALSSDNAQGELYLTDLVTVLGREHGKVSTMLCEDPDEMSGVNNPAQLAEVTEKIRRRINYSYLQKGVRFCDPSSVHISPRAEISPDVYIEPYVQVFGNSVIGERVTIGSFSQISNSTIGADTRLLSHVMIHDSCVESNVTAGPFCFIRNGSVLGENSLVGKFVEIKKSSLGNSSKVPHLSYIGDAEVGQHTNIGAGTITCNYDGINKNRTKIGSNCFVGSDTMLVAPVELEDNSYTAAGSVITSRVPEGSLAVARGRQRNIRDWARKHTKTDSQT